MTPQKTHRWTLEQKVTLVLLCREYQNSWHEKRILFNAYLEDELKTTHIFTEGALRRMYSQIENRFHRDFGTWTGIRSSLEARAISLNIALEASDRGQSSQLITPVRFPMPSSGLFTPSNGLSTPSKGLSTPSKDLSTPSNGLPTPSLSSGNKNSYRATKFPRLGFRGFSTSSQGYLLAIAEYPYTELTHVG